MVLTFRGLVGFARFDKFVPCLGFNERVAKRFV